MSDLLARLAALTPVAAAHVLHVYDHHDGVGYPPGSFTADLITLFGRADSDNFARLERAYPQYGAAIWLARNHPDGMTILNEIARRDIDSTSS